MTTMAVLRRRSNILAQRWLQTGGDHARAGVPSHHRSQPATATLNDNLDQQTQLPLSAGRVINPRERLCAPALAPYPSVKSP
jgi:hypothetical protein